MSSQDLFVRMEKDDFIFVKDDLKNANLFYALTEGNPGCITALMSVLKLLVDDDEIVQFYNYIYKCKVTGARLWYIYKNVCNKDANELLYTDLSVYNDDYFYEKFEKYL